MIRKKKAVIPKKLPELWRCVTNLQTLKQMHAYLITNAFLSKKYATTGVRGATTNLLHASAVLIFGAIDYAHKVFDQIPNPDVFQWNTIIRGAAQSRDPFKAVYLYARMDKNPDAYTFPFVMKACTRLGLVNMGYGVQGRIVKFGFESNENVRNALIHFHANLGDISRARRLLFDVTARKNVVAWSALTSGFARRGDVSKARQLFDIMPVKDMISWNVMISAYAKGGDMEKARELFERAPQKDVVTWNAMISGHVIRNSLKEALKMYEEMRAAGEVPDEVTMLSLISACAGLKDLEMGKKIHGTILEMGLRELNILLGNALIDMYAKCGDIVVALELFESMREKDISTWNSILVGLVCHGYASKTFEWFDRVKREKIKPDGFTFIAVLTACSHTGSVEQGQNYFKLMEEEYGIEPSIQHYGCMVDMLGRAGHVSEAFDLVQKMKLEPNAFIWSTLLRACMLHGDMELGMKAYEELLKRRPDQSGDNALSSSLLPACAQLESSEMGKKNATRTVLEKDPREKNILTGNALIDMYAKCGKITVALDVFESMREKNISTWNSILGGLACHGYAAKALEWLDRMLREKIKPDGITFIAVLTACSHTGNVEQGQYYFMLMEEEYGIEPSIQHYGCMVDLLGRAGRVSEAFDFIQKMKLEPNAVIWRTLLGACKVHGHMELGLKASEELLKRRQDQSGDYVLSSSILASVGKWDGVENVRNLMDDTGVRKEHGYSLIEAGSGELVNSSSENIG